MNKIIIYCRIQFINNIIYSNERQLEIFAQNSNCNVNSNFEFQMCVAGKRQPYNTRV